LTAAESVAYGLVKEQKQMARSSDHRVWLLLASFAVAALMWACSSDNAVPSGGSPNEGASDAMTQG
jgi:hypothetical protein